MVMQSLESQIEYCRKATKSSDTMMEEMNRIVEFLENNKESRITRNSLIKSLKSEKSYSGRFYVIDTALTLLRNMGIVMIISYNEKSEYSSNVARYYFLAGYHRMGDRYLMPYTVINEPSEPNRSEYW